MPSFIPTDPDWNMNYADPNRNRISFAMIDLDFKRVDQGIVLGEECPIVADVMPVLSVEYPGIRIK